jgi:hypothetical protein
MAIFSTRVTVTTDPTLLVPGYFNPQKAKLLNASPVVVRVGGPDVTVNAYGLPALPDNPNVPRTEFDFDLNANEAIWGIVASGSAVVNVWYQQA